MSDIDTAAVDSLKALDPKRPIREADIPDIPIVATDVRFRGVKRTLTTRVGRTPRASARIAPGAPHLY